MNPLLILGLVAILAFIAPFFSRALKLPLVVGEILFGVLVGTIIHLLGLMGIHADLTSSELEILATLGFITLMFIIGMENDLEDLRTLTRREKWELANLRTVRADLFRRALSLRFPSQRGQLIQGPLNQTFPRTGNRRGLVKASNPGPF